MKKLKRSKEEARAIELLDRRDEQILDLKNEVTLLKQQINRIMEVVGADFRAGRFHESVTQYLISEFGMDVPERLRPRR